MKNSKLLLGLVLFALGLAGVLSMLTMEIPLSKEVLNLLLEKFTVQQIEFLKLANPLMMLIGAVVLGLFFHEKIHLEVPIIEGIIKKSYNFHLSSILKYGTIGGIICGVLLTVIAIIFTALSPQEITKLAATMKPTLVARFLYGGITEEILMRFGLMTFITWLLSKLFKTDHKSIYWTGILLTAFTFALSHLPVAFQTLGTPSFTVMSYILIGNSIGGITFGWLYWKKGLETAFIAHIAAHIIMVLAAWHPA